MRVSVDLESVLREPAPRFSPATTALGEVVHGDLEHFAVHSPLVDRNSQDFDIVCHRTSKVILGNDLLMYPVLGPEVGFPLHPFRVDPPAQACHCHTNLSCNSHSAGTSSSDSVLGLPFLAHKALYMHGTWNSICNSHGRVRGLHDRYSMRPLCRITNARSMHSVHSMRSAPHHAVMARSARVTGGSATRTVEMMPMSAYASAQNGSASGSLQTQPPPQAPQQMPTL